MVRERGLEPPRAIAHKALNLACLPVSALAHACSGLNNRQSSKNFQVFSF